MDGPVEHELCNNCKKEIPHYNYVMHTAHCARNITLCQTCKEPVPKNQFEDHKKTCFKSPTKTPKKPEVPLTNIEKSSYFQDRKSIEDKKAAARREQYLERNERFLDRGYSLRDGSSRSSVERYRESSRDPMPLPAPPRSRDLAPRGHRNATDDFGSAATNYAKTNGYTGAKPKEPTANGNIIRDTTSVPVPNVAAPKPAPSKPKTSSGMLACKYCDLELPKLELEEHENYCGSRTDKCLECGELVMYKYKQIHMDSNHGFLKLSDEPGPRASWDSQTQRTNPEPPRRRPLSPFTPFTLADATLYSFPSVPTPAPKEKGESYKEISRRLDCKTEYIRNLLHDSASITIPLRHSGTAPRNRFHHNKGPAPQPPRRRNPPTELTIPCEFCNTPIPHEDLIQHETGCRPDLARRRRSPSPDDYFTAPQPSSPEVELPCEFCADMIPASQLLRHQATCT